MMTLFNDLHWLFLIEVIHALHVGVCWLTIVSLNDCKPMFYLFNFARVLFLEVFKICDAISICFIDFHAENFVINFFLVDQSESSKNKIITDCHNRLFCAFGLTDIDQINWITISVVSFVVFPSLRDESVVKWSSYAILSQLFFPSLFVDIDVRVDWVVNCFLRHFKLSSCSFCDFNNTGNMVLVILASVPFKRVPGWHNSREGTFSRLESKITLGQIIVSEFCIDNRLLACNRYSAQGLCS